jgi:galactose mutarotase-like enzyme
VSTASDCRLRETTLSGWRALILENDRLQAVVLPERGAELLRLVDVPSGVNVLYEAHWGLQPPGTPPREGSGDITFQWNYGGGWQELFPNANHACTYNGQTLPFHGEVATLPWDVTVEQATAAEVAVLFTVRCRQTPFRLERRLRLKRGEATLYFEETVHNEAEAQAHFVWGQHAVVGAPFLEAGCRLEMPAQTFHAPPQIYEETSRLVPGQREAWPLARLRQGGRVDLQAVPGPEAHTHDGVFATGLSEGRLAVTNPRLGLTFSLHWDKALFPWVAVWMPYGGCEAMPLQGIYALGIEPWTAPHNLAQALAAGDAVALAGGASLTTALRATLTQAEGGP